MENVKAQERKKYEDVWNFEAYRQACHGLDLWMKQREIFPARVLSAIDFGCGTARLVKRWRQEGIKSWGVDLAVNAPDEENRKYVVQACLWDFEVRAIALSSGVGQFDLGVCADVMEHIPEEYVDAVIDNIQSMCRTVVYKIAYFPSVWEGRELHLTMKPASWWLEKLNKYGKVTHYPGRYGVQEFIFVVNQL